MQHNVPYLRLSMHILGIYLLLLQHDLGYNQENKIKKMTDLSSQGKTIAECGVKTQET